MKAKDFFQEHCLKNGIEGVNEYTEFNWKEVVSIMEAYADRIKKNSRLEGVIAFEDTGLTEANKKRMWDIDHKAQLGDDLSNEEVAFFNAHLDLMKIATRDAFEHFEYHSGKL